MKLGPDREASGDDCGRAPPGVTILRPEWSEIVTTEPYNPNTKGWGVAALIIALAIIANVTAYSIHKATYLKPDKAPASAEQGR